MARSTIWFLITADHKKEIESQYPPYKVQAFEWEIVGGPFPTHGEAVDSLQSLDKLADEAQEQAAANKDYAEFYRVANYRTNLRSVSRSQLKKYRIMEGSGGK